METKKKISFLGKVLVSFLFAGLVSPIVNTQAKWSDDCNSQYISCAWQDVSVPGDAIIGWSDEEVDAAPGELVEFVIGYYNGTYDTKNNVVIRDFLPDELVFEAGDSFNRHKKKNQTTVYSGVENIFTDQGLNLGTFAPWDYGYIYFRARVRDDLNVGTYSVVNRNSVRINGTAIGISEGTTTVNFTVEQEDLGGIQGVVYRDVNDNGDFDLEDPNTSVNRLDDWTVRLFEDNNGVVGTEIRNRLTGDSTGLNTPVVNGQYRFEDLEPGTYHVCFDLKEGWRKTEPAAVDTYCHIVPVSTTLVGGKQFGVIELPGTIQGQKIEDITGDGITDDDVSVADWTITLYPKDEAGVLGDGVSMQTDTEGQYQYTDLIAGTYLVCEEDRGGWSQLSPVDSGDNSNPEDGNETFCHIVDLAVGEGATDVSFINTEEGATIVGRKYEDKDKNGSKDGDDIFLNDWTITLYPKNDDGTYGDVSTTQTGDTGVEGQYKFENLHSGIYVVCEEDRNGWIQTSPNETEGVVNPDPDNNTTRCRYVDLSAGETEYRWFGNAQLLGLISGVKFNDVNEDAVKDAGEELLNNWTINLYNSDGDIEATAVTGVDVTGEYEFTSLTYGTYTVCEENQVEWKQMLPNVDTADTVEKDGQYCYSVEIDSEDGVNDVDFGNVMDYGTIQGRKFHDVNGDGSTDTTDDIVVDGWLITLYVDNNGTWDELTSMNTGDDSTEAGDVAEGQYKFIDLVVGTYLICEEDVDGWEQTVPQTSYTHANHQSTCHQVEVEPGEIEMKSFRNYATPGTISGRKFEDLTNNGYTNDDEPINGWTIILYPKNDDGTFETESTALTGHTGNDGQYEFANLSSGTYVVCEEEQKGWIQVEPSGGVSNPDTENNTRCRTITLDPGKTKYGRFVNRQDLGSISGVKYEDVDGDGEVSDDGVAIEGWEITLYEDNNGSWVERALMLTGVNGAYIFEDLEYGTYVVCEEDRYGWKQTYPQTGTGHPDPANSTISCYIIDLNLGELVENQDFGNVEDLGIIEGRKLEDVNENGINDDGGAAVSISDWGITLYKDNNGTWEVNSSMQTDAVSGKYLFENLSVGQYLVCEEDRMGWYQSYPQNGTSHPDSANQTLCFAVTIEPGTSVWKTFGNFENLGSISGVKFDDVNENATKNNGESLIGDWTITLYRDGVVESSMQTDAVSGYEFTDLVFGNYLVCEDDNPEWKQTLPTSGTVSPETDNDTYCYSVVLDPGDIVVDQDFGNVMDFGTIQGKKFNDVNGDGRSNLSDDIEMNDWLITLYIDNSGTWEVSNSMLTVGSGKYLFENLSVGQYLVCEQDNEDWVQTVPQSTTSHPDHQESCHNVNLLPGDVQWRTFRNTAKPGTILGRKFNDANGDGNVQSDGVMDGWTITLYPVNTDGSFGAESTMLTGDTGIAGQYKFDNLSVGKYLVCEEDRVDWSQTVPQNTTFHPNHQTSCYEVDIEPGTVIGRSFGNVAEPGIIQGRMFDDVNGDGDMADGVPMNDWSITLYRRNGGNWQSQDTRTTGISNTSTPVGVGQYRFSNLRVGEYLVCAEDRAGWNQTFPGSGADNPVDNTLCRIVDVQAGSTKFASFGNEQLTTNQPILDLIAAMRITYNEDSAMLNLLDILEALLTP